MDRIPHHPLPFEAWQAGFNRWTEQLRRLNDAMDPYGIAASFSKIAGGWLAHPQDFAAALARLGIDLQHLQFHAWQMALGMPEPQPPVAAVHDERFADPAWTEIPAFSVVKQYYLLYTHWLEDALYDTPDAEPKERRRVAFWARQWLNAIAPTNYLFTNPVAVRRFWETGGQSLVDGVRIWLNDLRVGDIQMVDRAAFKVGGNLATTPGAVVYRNRLMELIQYAPATPQVRSVPIVFVPPWINKYYILDLNEKKSMVRYLVNQGYTVFMVSWKNPTPDMADTGFEDYLMEGIGQAVDVARSIAASRHVHAVGYCIGGTALAAYMAWANREHEFAEEVPVAHWTLLTTLLDFSRPGAIEVFIDEDTVDTIEDMMAHQGYLDGREMGRAFRLLRSNNLIWHYFVHGYLYGETPPPFDVLYWNTDVTRMPQAMHSYYLREFYLANKLVQKDAVTLAGHPIDLERVRQPLYAVGCEEDHIAPWKATFSNTAMIDAAARYTLASSGHILGIINPPVTPPKRSYWTGDSAAMHADEWLKAQQEVPGTWWEDWVAWLAPRCGDLVAPPPLGSEAYPKLCDAPGTYVHET